MTQCMSTTSLSLFSICVQANKAHPPLGLPPPCFGRCGHMSLSQSITNHMRVSPCMENIIAIVAPLMVNAMQMKIAVWLLWGSVKKMYFSSRLAALALKI